MNCMKEKEEHSRKLKYSIHQDIILIIKLIYSIVSRFFKLIVVMISYECSDNYSSWKGNQVQREYQQAVYEYIW